MSDTQATSSSMLAHLKIAFIGGGNMASALISGLLTRGVQAANIAVVEPWDMARQALQAKFGLAVRAACDAALRDADLIVLAVKPQQFREMSAQLAPFIDRQVLMSVAAGIRLQDMQRWFNGHPYIVRAMPNTPALIGRGMTGLAALPGVSAAQRELAARVAGAVGQTLWVEREELIDSITAISGSGPAYVFYFIEAMQQAAAELGLSIEQGCQLAVQTFIGAAELAAQSSEPASVLRERVTSKGGTTYAALTALEEAGVKQTFVKAMHAAAARGKEMGEEFGQQ